MSKDTTSNTLRSLVAENGGEELLKIADADPAAFHDFAANFLKANGFTDIEVGTAKAGVIETDTVITIISVVNREPHNGDFQRLMDRIESLGKVVIVEALWNKQLRHYLILKRGYKACSKNGKKRVIKKPGEHL